MNLKQRFSLIFSSLFSLLLATVLVVIYYMFLNFRRDEFRARLAQRAETTVKFLVGVKGIDRNLLEIFDKNRANRLFNEKTSVFDANRQRIYTSNDSYRFNWSQKEFREIDQERHVVKRKRNYEVLGMLFQYGNKRYYVLVSAQDEYERTKMEYLRYLLLAAFCFGSAAVWALSFYLSKASLKPLDKVRIQIQEITDKSLDVRLPVGKQNNEIANLAKSFNQMMDRIDAAYQRQKEFTGNASHELRMPIARLTAQLQNLAQSTGLDLTAKKSLEQISKDAYQLSDMVTSLLLLSEVSNYTTFKDTRKVRLDEIIFDTAAHFSKVDADFRFNFRLGRSLGYDTELEVFGDEALLKVVFMNILKNAFMYSDNKSVNCTLELENEMIAIRTSNTGAIPNVADTDVLFNTFVRGSNVGENRGTGVGLSIVKRILQYHSAEIEYIVPQGNLNVLVIKFPKKMQCLAALN